MNDLEDTEDLAFGNKAGTFFTVLINNGKDEEYVIFTENWGFEADFLGEENCKKIIINGDVGCALGAEMRSGSIVLGGNAGDEVGIVMSGGKIRVDGDVFGHCGESMEGGEITIMGNVKPEKNSLRTLLGGTNYLGRAMENGKIVVMGDVSVIIGENMTGGEIHLEGDYESIGNVIHGKIYHKGKLIVDK